jgi:translation initiation factor 1 (eIF-1/SUI1)
MTDQDIINLRSADPFADVTGFNQTESGATGGATAQRSSNIIHIRIQQRSGKKTLTTVQVTFVYSFIHLLFSI